LAAEHLQASTGSPAPLPIWPAPASAGIHSSLQACLADATGRHTASVQARQVVPPSHAALTEELQRDTDPWGRHDDATAGLQVIPEHCLQDDGAVNGLVCSTHPAWCRAVQRQGQSAEAVASALHILSAHATNAGANAATLGHLHELLCPEHIQERELSIEAGVAAAAALSPSARHT
jgi:hypothetical protein